MTLPMLLKEFFMSFSTLGTFLSLIWVGRVVSLSGNASLVKPTRFPLLANLSANDQRRILHAADRQAFAGWRSCLPALGYALCVSLGIVSARALEHSGVLAGSVWLALLAGALIAAFVMALFRGLEVRRMTPFVRRETERNGPEVEELTRD
jgi:hypothetical protein